MIRKILLLSIGLLCAILIAIPTASKAQTTGINYQAIARDANGNTLDNQLISVRFAIKSSSLTGTIVYEEEHNLINTNEFGLINLIIGQGTRIGGTNNTFDEIDWGSNSHFIRISIDDGNTGFAGIDSTQLMYVPYAMYAQKSGDSLLVGNSGIEISNDTIYNRGDLSETNELISRFELINDTLIILNEGTREDTLNLSKLLKADSLVASFAGNDLYNLSIWGGNQIQFSVKDDDADALNEIQTLSLNGTSDSLILSNNGGKIAISEFGFSDNQQLSLSNDTLKLTGVNPSSVALASILGVDSIRQFGDSALIVENHDGTNDTLYFNSNKSEIDSLFKYQSIDSALTVQNRDSINSLVTLINNRSDNQNLSINGDTLFIERGDSVNLNVFRDTAAIAALTQRVNADSLKRFLADNNLQDGLDTLNKYFTIDSSLTIQNRDSINSLVNLINNSDRQNLSINGDTLFIERGDSVNLNVFRDTAAIAALTQRVNADSLKRFLADNNLQDGLDTLNKYFSIDSSLTIQNRDSINSLVNLINNSDRQNLSINGDTLFIERGDSVNLNVFRDTAAIAALTQRVNADSLKRFLADNNLQDGLDTLNKYFTIDSSLTVQNRDSINSLVNLINNSDRQNLSINGDTLFIERGDSVNLNVFRDTAAIAALTQRVNADSLKRFLADNNLQDGLDTLNKYFAIDSALTIQNRDSINSLVTLINNSDRQNLSINGDTLFIERGDSVNLNVFRDTAAIAALTQRVNADSLKRFLADNNLQDGLDTLNKYFSIDSSLTIQNRDSINSLVNLINNSDRQNLSINGDTLFIERGDSVNLNVFRDTAAIAALTQRVNADSLKRFLADNNLQDGLDTLNKYFTIDSSLTIQNRDSINSLVNLINNSDRQNLSINGDTLFIERGDSVNLNVFRDTAAIAALTQRVNADSLKRFLADNNLQDGLDTLNKYFAIDSTLTIQNRDSINSLVTLINNSDRQNLSINGDTLFIERGDSVNLNVFRDTAAIAALTQRVNADSLKRFLADNNLQDGLDTLNKYFAIDSALTIQNRDSINSLVTLINNSDRQNLSINGDTLFIERGDSVNLNVFRDTAAIAALTQRVDADSLKRFLADNNLQDGLDTLNKYFAIDSALTIQNRDSINSLVTLINNSDRQNLSINGDTLFIERGDSVNLNVFRDTAAIAALTQRVNADSLKRYVSDTTIQNNITANAQGIIDSTNNVRSALVDTANNIRSSITTLNAGAYRDSSSTNELITSMTVINDSLVIFENGQETGRVALDSLGDQERAALQALIMANQSDIGTNQTAITANAQGIIDSTNNVRSALVDTANNIRSSITTLNAGAYRDSSSTNELITSMTVINDSLVIFENGQETGRVALDSLGDQERAALQTLIMANQSDIGTNQAAITANAQGIIDSTNNVRSALVDTANNIRSSITTLNAGAYRDSSSTNELITSMTVINDSLVIFENGQETGRVALDSLGNQERAALQALIMANQSDIATNRQAIIDSVSNANANIADTAQVLRTLIGNSNTDDQQLSLSTNTLNLTGDNPSSVNLTPILGVDSVLKDNDSTLNIKYSDGSVFPLQILGSQDNDTDANNELVNSLNLNGSNELELLEGNAIIPVKVDLSSLNNSGTDDQNLSISATKGTISIEDGNSIELADSSATNEAQSISRIGNTVTLTDVNGTGGGTFTDSTLTESDVDVMVSNNGFLTTEVDGSVSNEIQTLSFNTSNDNLTISGTGGNTVDLSSIRDSSLTDLADTASVLRSALVDTALAIRATIDNLTFADDDDWTDSGSNTTVVETSKNTSIGTSNTFTTFSQNALSVGSSISNQGTNSVGLGNNISITGDNSINMGFRNSSSGIRAHTIGSWISSTGSDAITIGGGASGSVLLSNTLDSTIMLGYRSNLPTMTIRPAKGSGTVGEVGIGTTSPDSLLTVAGGINAEYIRLTGGAFAGRVLVSDANGNATWQDPNSLISDSDNQNLDAVGDSIVIDNGRGAYIGDIRDTLSAHNTRIGNNSIDISSNFSLITSVDALANSNSMRIVQDSLALRDSSASIRSELSDTAAVLRTAISNAGDNLGDHKATSNIQLNSNYLSNDGDNEGIKIDNSGFIGLGTNPNTNARVAINETSVGQGLYVIQQDNSSTRSAIKGEVRGANGTEIYALEGEATSTGANNYGLHAIATGAGTTNFGVFGKALGASTNWAGYFDDGNVFIKDTLYLNKTLKLTAGAGINKILSSDANGVAKWEDVSTLFTDSDNQTLSFTGNQLTITDGNSVTLTDTTLNEAEVDAFVSNNGYLTSEVDGSVTNETNTGFAVNGANLEITDSDGTLSVPLSSISTTDTISIIQSTDKNRYVETANSGEIVFGVNGSDRFKIRENNIEFAEKTVLIGQSAGANQSFGSNIDDSTANIAIGNQAMMNNGTSRGEIAIGAQALRNSGSSASLNVAVGSQALFSNDNGTSGTAVGSFALKNVNSGSNNTAFGANALTNVTIGAANTAIGSGAGSQLTNGGDNIFIGVGSGVSGSYSERLYIDNNGGGGTPLIYGDLAEDSLVINGVLTIDSMKNGSGYTLPGRDGSANQIIKTDGSGKLTFVDASTIVSGDNLGNHIATNNIQMGNNFISNDGDSEGISIDPAGEVSFLSTTGNSLTIAKGGGGESSLMEFLSYGSGNTAGTIFDLYNARGNSASKTAVQNGDRLFTMKSKAYYDPTNVVDNELMTIKVDGSVSTSIVPTQIGFNTVAANGVSNEILTIRSSGAVGIGNTSPDSALTVNGGIKSTYFTMTNGATNNYVLASDANGVATWTDPSTLVSGDDLGDHKATTNIQLSGNYLSNDGDSEGIHVAANGNVTVGSDKGFNQFGVWNSSATAEISIFSQTNSSVLEMGAFGTSESNTISAFRSRGAWLSGTSVLAGDDIFNIEVAPYNGSSSTVTDAMVISVDAVSGSNISTRIDFSTVNVSGIASERLSIDDAGNVGIGTTGPGYPLHVSGSSNTTVRIDAGTNNRAALQLAETTGTFGSAATGFELSYNGADDKFMFRRASGSSIDTVMTLDRSTGYVGIQNHSPVSTLDVEGAIKVSGVVATPVAGMIQWNGTDFEGYDGANWNSLTSSNSTCPSGMEEVRGLCIEENERTASDWFDAANTCRNLGYKLPTWAEWYSAMNSSSTSVTNKIDDWEWVDGGTSNTARKVGNGDLKNTANDDPDTGSEVFRCVFYLK